MSIQEQKITEAAIAENGVQSQPDKLTGTAAQNKKVFDALVTAVVRERFNALIDELTGTGAAEQLGITTIPGFSADNIQAMLEQIVTAMQDITQGSVADGSITLAKLAAEVTAAALGGAAASHTHGAGDVNSGTLDAARIPVLDSTKIGTGSVGSAQLGAAVVTSEKLAALAVLAQHIANKAVTAAKLADDVTAAAIGALPASGGTLTGQVVSRVNDNYPFYALRSGSVGFYARNENRNVSVTLEVTGDKAGIYTGGKWLIHSDGSNSYIDGLLYRHIYVGTSDAPPSGWKSGDIYLQYT